ncbi:hypothetical protein, partial [Enterococcus faecium]|uniref:hypothetical protein n=1 Tax=Enterococcus faecium TaxID=1352 RepID=UPI0034E9418F
VVQITTSPILLGEIASTINQIAPLQFSEQVTLTLLPKTSELKSGNQLVQMDFWQLTQITLLGQLGGEICL